MTQPKRKAKKQLKRTKRLTPKSMMKGQKNGVVEESNERDEELITSPAKDLASSQIALKDERIPIDQRHDLAAKIGQVQGNQHLQKVFTAPNQNSAVKSNSSPFQGVKEVDSGLNISSSELRVARFIRGDDEAKKKNKTKDEKEETTEKKEEKEVTDKIKLEETLKKVDEMIRVARQVPGGKYAADNLEYWKSKKGGTKIMPVDAFLKEAFIIEWLRDKPRSKFLEGAEKRLKSGELIPGGTVDMYWRDFLYAPEGSPLYYALGGFTIQSDVVVKATPFPKDVGGSLISFKSWTCQAFDDYNWDKLKSTVIPLFGEISDDELLVLEKYGYGTSFKVELKPWTITDLQCLQEVAIG